MKHPLLRFFAVTNATFSLCVLSSSASAELGNAPSYLTPDEQIIQHQIMPPAVAWPEPDAAVNRYLIHQTTLHSGTVVREYTSLAGTAFGIAWSGKQMPDLRTLLGPTYFQTYLDALKQRNQAPHGLNDPVLIKTNALVVESIGHQNAFFGRAYLPEALRQLNVSEDTIQFPKRNNQPNTHSR